MKQLLAFILLLSHINTSMFFPVVVEQDIFNKHGVQVDDINSIVEYVAQDVMGQELSKPDDEDNDQPQYYHLSTLQNYVCFDYLDLQINSFPQPFLKNCSVYKKRISTTVKEIVSPPPDTSLLIPG